MNYIELRCQIHPFTQEASEILMAQLGEIDYESFTQREDGIDAYIQQPLFQMEKVNNLLINNLPQATFSVQYSHKVIEDQDWNALWESNFQPVIITDQVVIRASFHKDTPKVPYEIVIDPKMSFGTGHHSTTSLMVQTILDTPLQGKNVLDMGCGTSILAMLASQRGARQVTAIDIDEWPYRNSLENIRNNGIKNINVFMGDASLLKDQKFDVVLANINRNILLQDMEHYIRCLSKNGILIMSGFYTQDLDAITSKATLCEMEYVSHKTDNNWVAVKFFKK